MAERMIKPLAKRNTAALAAAVTLLAGIPWCLAFLVGSGSYTLITIIVELSSIPGAGKLYDWAEVIALAPGARPLTKTVEVKPGDKTVRIVVDATRLVKESMKAISEASSPDLAGVLRDEASAVAVFLVLYDERCGHYLASATIGSYDVALRKHMDMVKAFHAVEHNPYLVLHSGTIVVGSDAFSIVNVTSLYRDVVEEYYKLPNPARRWRS